MLQQHHVIYVPGITDNATHVQGFAVRLWFLRGLHGHLHVMPWAGQEAYEPKHQRLLAQIDALLAKGHKVSLVGASAGASAVLNAYAERRENITGLVYISGKINFPETVSPKTYQDNPAFKTALVQLQPNVQALTAEDKAKMLSLYPKTDNTVSPADNLIPGIPIQRLSANGHGKGIVDALTLQFHLIARFLKHL